MGKRVFYIFLAVIASAIGSVVMYVESQHFASLVRERFRVQLERQLGLEIEFDHFQITAFPPGLAIINPKVTKIQKDNVLDIPPNAVIRAEEIGITMRMFQTFGKRLVVNRVYLDGAVLRLTALESKSNATSKSTVVDKKVIDFLSKPMQFTLESGLELDVRQLDLKNSQLEIKIKKKSGSTEMLFIEKIRSLTFRPEDGFYSSVVDLENVAWDIAGQRNRLDAIKANVEINPKIIRIVSLELNKEGSAISVGGLLQGDIRFPQKLKGEIRVVARSRPKGLLWLFPDAEAVDGDFGAELSIAGSLRSYTIKGELNVTDFKYLSWDLNKVNAKVEITNKKLSIKSLIVENEGGSVQLEPLEIDLKKSRFTQNVTLVFDEATLSSFSGELKKSINQVEMVLNNRLKISLDVEMVKKKFKLHSLEISPDLKISEFRLTNQIYGKDRRRKVIFGLSDFDLNGLITWKDQVISVMGLDAITQYGGIRITGLVDKKTGLSLVAKSTEIDLGKAVGRIAGTRIQGKGPLKIVARGPTSRLFLDFEFDLNDAKYINLNLGSIRGTVTLDEDPSMVYLRKLVGRKQIGKYTVDGFVDASGSDKLDLDVRFFEVGPDDLFEIFENQVSNFKWIPKTMKGKISGTAKVSGTYEDSERTMKIQGILMGRRLIYFGEILSELKAEVGLVDGIYYAKSVRAKKYNAIVTGALYYNLKGILTYKFNVDRARLRDLDSFSRLGIPIDAEVRLEGWGTGPPTKLKSSAEMHIRKAHIGVLRIPSISMKLESNAQKIELMGYFGGNENSGLLRWNRGNSRPSKLNIALKDADFLFVMCILNEDYCVGSESSFSADANIEMNWAGDNWERMNGRIDFDRVELKTKDFDLSLVEPTAGIIKNGDLKFKSSKIVGEGTTLTIDSRGKISGQDFLTKIKGNVSLKLLHLVSPLLSRIEGNAQVNLSLKGSVDKLRTSGDIDLENLSFAVRKIYPRVENVNGRIEFLGNRAVIDRMEGRFGQGRLSFDGFVDLYLNDFPTFNLGMNFNQNRVRFQPVKHLEVDRGRLTFTGNQPPYKFGGKIKVRSAFIDKNFDDIGQSGRKTAKYLPKSSYIDNSIYELDITAVAPKGILIQNELLDAEFSGSITILGTFEHPQFLGNAELVKGDLLFRNTRFALDHAVLKQTKPENLDPWFSLGGKVSLGSYQITLFASGTASEPKLSLGSSPTLRQESILSLLAFGFLETGDGNIDPNDINTITFTELSSILLDKLRIKKDLKSRGLNIRVAPTVIQNEANIIRPRDATDTAVPKLIVQTIVIDDVDASLGTSVGTRRSQQFDLNLEFHLNDKISIQSVYEQEPGVDAGEIRKSFGADLKFKWGFK